MVEKKRNLCYLYHNGDQLKDRLLLFDSRGHLLKQKPWEKNPELAQAWAKSQPLTLTPVAGQEVEIKQTTPTISSSTISEASTSRNVEKQASQQETLKKMSGITKQQSISDVSTPAQIKMQVERAKKQTIEEKKNVITVQHKSEKDESKDVKQGTIKDRAQKLSKKEER